MSLRLPNITGATADAKLSQLTSYMYQMVEELNWAMSTLESSASVGSKQIVQADGSALPTETPLDTFNSIKALIIKSADIISAYTDEMRLTFNGEYTAKSEFGDYQKNEQSRITATASNLLLEYDTSEEVDAKLDELSSKIDTSGFIKTGNLEIYENDDELFGIAVGEKTVIDGKETFNAFATFTPNKLAFYGGAYDENSNPIPVAYISKQRLYITDARILGDLYIGKYVLDTSEGITFRWVGGGS